MYRTAKLSAISTDKLLKSLQTEYTMGRKIGEDRYHVSVIRGTMTRSLAAVFPEIREEVMESFKQVLPLSGSGIAHFWTSFVILFTI
jgi:hypothetical protein